MWRQHSCNNHSILCSAAKHNCLFHRGCSYLMYRGKPLICVYWHCCILTFIYCWFLVINKPENMTFRQSLFIYMSLYVVFNYTIKLCVQIIDWRFANTVDKTVLVTFSFVYGKSQQRSMNRGNRKFILSMPPNFVNLICKFTSKYDVYRRMF